jgi:hypothetical protein
LVLRAIVKELNVSETTAFPPEQELAFFGAPPLLKGEDPYQYNQLLETVSGTVQPADIFDRAFVRTIVSLIWEDKRYRRLAAETITAAEVEALEQVLRPLMRHSCATLGRDPDHAQTLAEQFVLGNADAIYGVDALLAEAHLDWETVKAAAFSLRRPEIEALNRLVTSAEARMKSTLREIDRHRKTLGRQQTIKQLDNSEFTVVEERKRAA